jgi:FkbM family methyltransferase
VSRPSRGAAFTSYAQNHEDVVLARALRPDERRGFWIDVGAGDPVVDSVTAAFAERGWHGINVEPLEREHQALVEARPDDVNLCLALGAAPGVAKLFEGPDGNRGSSTLRAELAEEYRAGGQDFRATEVPVTTLAHVVADHAPDVVDLLKVDVEGFEAEVLAGADWSRFRPRVIVVEATVPNSSTPSHQAWEPMLLGLGYELALFDGLNRFYARGDEPALVAALSVPANVLDGYVPHEWSSRFDEAQAWARSLDGELGRTRAALDEAVGQAEAAAAALEAHRAELAVVTAGRAELELAAAVTAEAVRALRDQLAQTEQQAVDLARTARYERDLGAVAREEAAVARQDLAASERLTSRALAARAQLEAEVDEAELAVDGALAQLDEARAERAAVQAELDELRATRTFRHTHAARRIYGAVRQLLAERR